MPDGAEAATEARAAAPARDITLPRVTAAQVALAVILIAAFVTRFGRLATPGEFYFDEIYFVRDSGQQIYRGDASAWEFYGHENTHPPLSKLFIAGGIAIISAADEVAPPLVPGDGGLENAFAWRFFGALAGFGAVVFMYLLARKLFDSEIAGLTGAFLLTVEGLAFAQSRIATPDTYVLCFMLATVYFLVSDRFLFSGIFFGAAVACKWVAALTAVPILLYLIWLLLTRLRDARSDRRAAWFEITLPSGLTVLYMGLALVILGFLGKHPDRAPGLFDALGPMDLLGWMLTVAGGLTIAGSLIGIIREYSARREIRLSPPGKVALEVALVLGVFFILVPGFVYFLTYVPFLANPPSVEAMGGRGFLGLGQVIRQNRLAFDFHSTLNQPHPYSSSWDQWPIDGRPVFFYLGSGYTKIYSLGNPIVFWAGLPALAFVLWQGLRNVAARIDVKGMLSLGGRLSAREAVLVFILLSYLGFWLPWAYQQETGGRVLFIYHYLPALAFVILALSYAMDWLWHRPDRPPGLQLEATTVESATRDVLLGIMLVSTGVALTAANSALSDVDLADAVFFVAIIAGVLLISRGVARGPVSYSKAVAVIFLGCAAATFVYFYPHLAAVNVPEWLDRTYYWDWLANYWDWVDDFGFNFRGLGFNWH